MTIGYGSTVSPEQEQQEMERYDISSQSNRAKQLADAHYIGQKREKIDLNEAILTGDTELVSQWVAGLLSTTDGDGIKAMKTHLEAICRFSEPSRRPASMGWQGATPSWGNTQQIDHF